MNSSFDPVLRLIANESIRFVGSIGESYSDPLQNFVIIVEQFDSREIRSGEQLYSVLHDATSCKPSVARTAVDVAVALGILAPVSQLAGARSRYVLDECGRVIRAMKRSANWIHHSRRRSLFFRPLFERHGDYLLQAIEALTTSSSTAEAVSTFRNLVTQILKLKLSEIPSNLTGSKWDAYRMGLKERLEGNVGRANSGNTSCVTIKDIQKKKQSDFRLIGSTPKKVLSGGVDQNGLRTIESNTKTLEHQLVRCRAWLIALDLIMPKEKSYKLTKSGESLVSYLSMRLNRTKPWHIPPSEAALSDCFRMSPGEIAQIWGCIINDGFWEEAILAIEGKGQYIPSEREVYEGFNAAFEAVQIPQILEATVSGLRQVLFLSWLWDGKPVSASIMDAIISGEQSIPRRFPSEFGYGRNRQGRIAYLFKKSSVI